MGPVAGDSQEFALVRQLALAIAAICGSVGPAAADGQVHGVVNDLSGQPVSEASVIITSADGAQVKTRTDPTGHYGVVVHGTGPYHLLVAVGGAHVDARIAVPADGEAMFRTVIDAAGEVIEVYEPKRPAVPAKPKSVDRLAVPRYSEAAVMGDHWTRAWLMLDVDAHGVVMRAKFLKRPGYDLDDIALQHVFAMRFSPARDERGVAARSYVVWPVEWPSMTWLASRGLPPGRLPVFAAMTQFEYDGKNRTTGGVVRDSYPACAGEGPMKLDDKVPMLRDCSVPNLAVADAREPWVERDVTMPAPAAEEAPPPGPILFRQDQLAELHRARVTTYVETATTAALVAGAVLSFTQFHKWSERVDYDRAHSRTVSIDQYGHDQSHRSRWEASTLGLAAGAAVLGILAGQSWAHLGTLTVQTVGTGGHAGAVSYSTRF